MTNPTVAGIVGQPTYRQDTNDTEYEASASPLPPSDPEPHVQIAGTYSAETHPETHPDAVGPTAETLPAEQPAEYRPYGLQYAATDDRFVASPTVQDASVVESPVVTSAPETQDAPAMTTYNTTEVITPIPRRGRQFSSPERHNSAYGDWMAPANESVGGGVVGAEAYRQYHEPDSMEDVPTDAVLEPEPLVSATAGPADVTTPAAVVAAEAVVTAEAAVVAAKTDVDAISTATSLDDIATPVHERTSFGGVADGPLASADEPSATRSTTETTVSNLHIPGEYPKEQK